MILTNLKVKKKSLKGELYFTLVFDFKPSKGEIERCEIEFRKGMPGNNAIVELYGLIKAIRES